MHGTNAKPNVAQQLLLFSFLANLMQGLLLRLLGMHAAHVCSPRAHLPGSGSHAVLIRDAMEC